jgi:hypothetical protein
MSEPRPWHRLFGLSLVDFFRGMPVSVELEKDLSLKQQLLDVVLRKLPPEERLKGLSTDDLLAALSPEARAELARRLKDYPSPPNTATREAGHGDGSD